MIKVIDTCDQLEELFENDVFNISKWENYVNAIYPDISYICKADLEEMIKSGEYSYEKYFLKVIEAVYKAPSLEILHHSFLRITKDLEQSIQKHFGKSIEVDIVLYLGLCNAAGWVTQIQGRNVILLGIEKILELGWYDLDHMYGLIYHELGHVYQAQYGTLERECEDPRHTYVWQLFTEGIAMYFEQVLVGDLEYFHQDRNGWKEWCQTHLEQILEDFDRDISSMDRMTQRYFGDLCDYFGHGDVGYYLGNKFVHYLLDTYSLDTLINSSIEDIYTEYRKYYEKTVSLH